MEDEIRNKLRYLINELLTLLDDEEFLGEEMAFSRERLEYLNLELRKIK